MPKFVWIAGLLALSPGLATAQSSPPRASLAPTPAIETVVDIPLAEGGRQRVLLVRPERPRATIVMLSGGSGEIGERRDGALEHGDNFVVRTRDLWASHGFAVLIPDTIDDLNLRGRRSSAAYGRLLAGLAGYARRTIGKPVVLLGTSQGAIAAMNGAAHARPGDVAGLVLSEAVSIEGRSGETIFAADPSGVTVPALVVANVRDRCDVAPPDMAATIAKAMAHSPDVRTLSVDGGIQRSARACGSLSPHGYYGIESDVVASISRWIDATLARRARGGDRLSGSRSHRSGCLHRERSESTAGRQDRSPPLVCSAYGSQ